MKSGAKFAAAGMQIAGGVPLQVDEGDDFSTFRLGLFGLDKLHNVDRTVASLEAVLDRVLRPRRPDDRSEAVAERDVGDGHRERHTLGINVEHGPWHCMADRYQCESDVAFQLG